MNKRRLITFKCNERTHAALTAQSKSDHRSRSMQVVRYVRDGLVKDGHKLIDLDPEHVQCMADVKELEGRHWREPR